MADNVRVEWVQPARQRRFPCLRRARPETLDFARHLGLILKVMSPFHSDCSRLAASMRLAHAAVKPLAIPKYPHQSNNSHHPGSNFSSS